MNKDYISVEDYAKHVKGVSKSYVHRLVREGKLDYVKRDGKTLILTDMTPELMKKLGLEPEAEPVEAEVHDEFTEDEPRFSDSKSGSQEGSQDESKEDLLQLLKGTQLLRAQELKNLDIEARYSKELEAKDALIKEAREVEKAHLQEVIKGRKSITRWAVALILTVIAFSSFTYWLLIQHSDKVETVRAEMKSENQTKLKELEVDLNYRIDQNLANHEKEVQYMKMEKERELKEQKELYQQTIKGSDERWRTQLSQLVSISANQESELKSELGELRQKHSDDQDRMNALEVQLRLSLEKISELKESIKAKEIEPKPIPLEATGNTQKAPLLKDKEVQKLEK